MNEVDNIIFQNFLSLGWEKETEINSLQDLEVSEISKLMVKCLCVINSETDLPQSLPHNMSQRFRVAAKIAEAIKDLGYTGDLGYQSILYSNEADLRKIFTFLIEKLPKDAPTLTKEPLGKSVLIRREACRKINEMLQRPWIPPHCANVARKYKTASSDCVSLVQHGTSHCHSFTSSWQQCHKINSLPLPDIVKNEADSEYRSHVFGLPSHQILPTLLNCHSEQLGKKLPAFEDDDSEESLKKVESRPKISSRYKDLKRSDLIDIFKETRNDSTPEEKLLQEELVSEASSLKNAVNRLELQPSVSQQAKETEVSQQAKEIEVEQILKAKEDDAQKKLSDVSLQISQLQESINEVVQACEEKKASIDSLQKTVAELETELVKEQRMRTLLSKTSALTTDPEASKEKLKTALKASKERGGKLMRQWMEFKEPLEEEMRLVTSKLETKRSQHSEMENEISQLKKNTQSLVEEAKKKEALLVQLREQKKKMTKGANRSVYTKQILDISSKVQKQKQEIQKILSETRIIQKEINTLTGKLQRTFAVVEDASFKAASANERARPIYRSVITIHEECGALVDIVRETSCIQREMADLQQQLTSEKAKNVEDNLKKLQLDFNSIQKENAVLKQKLKAVS